MSGFCTCFVFPWLPGQVIVFFHPVTVFKIGNNFFWVKEKYSSRRNNGESYFPFLNMAYMMSMVKCRDILMPHFTKKETEILMLPFLLANCVVCS